MKTKTKMKSGENVTYFTAYTAQGSGNQKDIITEQIGCLYAGV